MLRSEKKASASTSTSTSPAAASMLGGRTARVCDSCLCKRARWFCAADDAFLCQACDVQVHSANQLAKRHDRIRLETSSFKSKDRSEETANRSHLPPWLKGFTRKARTPRPNKQLSVETTQVLPLVPEIGNDEELLDENEEHELHDQFHHHQVPVFDPFDEEKILLTDELEDFADGFLPSEVDLAEFVADVESLLGRQQDEDDTQTRVLKVKNEEQEDGINSFWDWNFKGEENEEAKAVIMVEDEMKKKKKKIFLRLDYDAVITAWDGKSSPYTTGNRPELDVDDFLGDWGGCGVHESGEKGNWSRKRERKDDGEREARVRRYREKRRRRLFSKKIRYQVRKLNAEKRPRMKGRFVKRTMTSFIASNHANFPHYHPIN